MIIIFSNARERNRFLRVAFRKFHFSAQVLAQNALQFQAVISPVKLAAISELSHTRPLQVVAAE